MNVEQTNQSLMKYYNRMPTLDDRDIRDQLIMRYIEETEEGERNLEKLNSLLREKKLEELKFKEKEKEKKMSKGLLKACVEPRVRVFSFDEYKWANDLHTQFSPEKYRYLAEMGLEDTHGNTYKIEVHEIGKSAVYAGNSMQDAVIDEKLKVEMKEYIRELTLIFEEERKKILNMLDDTKNFNQRFGAYISKNKLYIYAEVFNYRSPERNEYLQVEGRPGEYKVSVSRKSVFMKKFLQEQYSNYYSTPLVYEKTILYSYGADVVEKIIASDKTAYILKEQHKFWVELIKKLDDLYVKLKSGNIFVVDPDPYGMEDGDLCRYYELEDKFACEQDEMGEIWPGKDCIEIEDGVKISLHDLHRAFELGIKKKEEIISIIKSQGNIEAVFD